VVDVPTGLSSLWGLLVGDVCSRSVSDVCSMPSVCSVSFISTHAFNASSVVDKGKSTALYSGSLSSLSSELSNKVPVPLSCGGLTPLAFT